MTEIKTWSSTGMHEEPIVDGCHITPGSGINFAPAYGYKTLQEMMRGQTVYVVIHDWNDIGYTIESIHSLKEDAEKQIQTIINEKPFMNNEIIIKNFILK